MLWASGAASVVELHPSGISPFSTTEAASGSSREGALSSGRARLEFDLSGLPAGLTAAELVNARLRLWIEEGSRKGTLAARSVTAVRAVVSSTRDAALRLGRAEISRVAVPETAGGSFARLDLTALVRSWLSGEAPNHGVALVASGGGVEVELSGAGGGAERSPVLELEVARELSPSAGDALWS
ncbi:MAG TPA: DNRLRE domain-containing protein, partial [Candidatus Polarisedimenticolia bacterium]|nr:DNRLRE domain-containing protein [Candidatus Polarisedimenticolia bacterium]